MEAVSTVEGHHYKYEKNSVLLMGEWKMLAVKNLGQNIQPIHSKHIHNRQSYSCDGCSFGSPNIGKARYICQGCRMDPNSEYDYVDFCEDCLEKSIKK